VRIKQVHRGPGALHARTCLRRGSGSDRFKQKIAQAVVAVLTNFVVIHQKLLSTVSCLGCAGMRAGR
jgi:hypothetical protein